MTSGRWMIAAATMLGLLAVAAPCMADATGSTAAGEPRLAVEEAQRPLTLPRFVLDPTGSVDVRRVDAHEVYGDLTGAVSFGATDDLVVRALVLPLQLAAPGGDGFHYGQTAETRGPDIGATYRLVRGSVELGLGLDLSVFTAAGLTGGAITPTVPLRIHAGEHLRIDAAATFTITRATSTTPAAETVVDAGGGSPATETTLAATTSASSKSLQVPLTALYSVLPSLYLGVKSGLTIDHIVHPRTSTGVPVGVFAGYTLAGKSGPLLDLEPFFTFPYLVSSGVPSPTNTGEYYVGLRVRGFLYL